jgi:hypothetical protein
MDQRTLKVDRHVELPGAGLGAQIFAPDSVQSANLKSGSRKSALSGMEIVIMAAIPTG